MALISGTNYSVRLNGMSLRLLFWVSLGLACSAFASVGIIMVMGVIVALAVRLAAHKDVRNTLEVVVQIAVAGFVEP